MASYQVTCINKQPRNNPHEGITHLGGAGWKITRADMINRINSKSDSFYTSAGGRTAHVGVVNGANGPYVQTHADGSWNNNLLSLPECA